MGIFLSLHVYVQFLSVSNLFSFYFVFAVSWIRFYSADIHLPWPSFNTSHASLLSDNCGFTYFSYFVVNLVIFWSPYETAVYIFEIQIIWLKVSFNVITKLIN